MRCLDSTLVIDLVKGTPAAVERARVLDEASERLGVPAPVIAEVLLGAYFKGGETLTNTLELMATFEVVPIDGLVAAEAGRIGADLLRRGSTVPTIDLLIAAAAKLRQAVLVTRDTAFHSIPNLAVESY